MAHPKNPNQRGTEQPSFRIDRDTADVTTNLPQDDPEAFEILMEHLYEDTEPTDFQVSDRSRESGVSVVPPSATETSRERFDGLKAQWKQERFGMSRTREMAMLLPYQKIIGMGKDAIPFVIEELRSDPDWWFWALEALTDAPLPPDEINGDLALLTQYWINQAEDQDL